MIPRAYPCTFSSSFKCRSRQYVATKTLIAIFHTSIFETFTRGNTNWFFVFIVAELVNWEYPGYAVYIAVHCFNVCFNVAYYEKLFLHWENTVKMYRVQFQDLPKKIPRFIFCVKDSVSRHVGMTHTLYLIHKRKSKFLQILELHAVQNKTCKSVKIL